MTDYDVFSDKCDVKHEKIHENQQNHAYMYTSNLFRILLLDCRNRKRGSLGENDRKTYKYVLPEITKSRGQGEKCMLHKRNRKFGSGQTKNLDQLKLEMTATTGN